MLNFSLFCILIFCSSTANSLDKSFFTDFSLPTTVMPGVRMITF